MGEPYFAEVNKGGGVRGGWSASVRRKIHSEAPSADARTHHRFGVSTGGIISVGRAAGLSWDDIVGLYQKDAARIFADTWWDDIKDMGKLRGADYGSVGLHEVLTGVLGSKTLGDLEGQVGVLTFALDRKTRGIRRWAPRVLRNAVGDPHRSLSAVEACMQTSAAPLYFPARRDRRPEFDTFAIDGGVVMNNPALVAIGEAVKHLRETRGCTSAEAIADIHILNIGTGIVPKYVDTSLYEAKDELDWGAIDWLKHLVDILLDGPSFEISHLAELILGDRYHEVETVYSEEIGLDAADKVPQLVAMGQAHDVTPTVEWLRRVGWADARA